MSEKLPYSRSGLYRRQLISEIAQLEWEMFSAVPNVGGPAVCQNRKDVFFVMRAAQHAIWSDDTLESYRADLLTAQKNQLNLMTCKYGYMMAKTFPEEYEELKNRLPQVSEEKRTLAAQLTRQHMAWTKEAADRYPGICSHGRPLDEISRYTTWPSVENYFFCELLTYSCATLQLCARDFEEDARRRRNPAIQILNEIAVCHGYTHLEELETTLTGGYGGGKAR